MNYAIASYIDAWKRSAFAEFDMAPWLVVQQAEALIQKAVTKLDPDYRMDGGLLLP